MTRVQMLCRYPWRFFRAKELATVPRQPYWCVQYSSCMLQTTTDQRNRLVTSTARLAQSGDRIKESKRQMIETEELGVSILQDLHQQRQTLLNTQNTVSFLHVCWMSWFCTEPVHFKKSLACTVQNLTLIECSSNLLPPLSVLNLLHDFHSLTPSWNWTLAHLNSCPASSSCLV